MNFSFTTDQSKMSLDVIHGFLTHSYWSPGIPKDMVLRAMEGSVCFAMLNADKQVAFGRFVTDKTTFAYLADVFVLPEFRGQGISKEMIEQALALPELQGLRRIMLATSTAHGLYERFGFKALADPDMMMEKRAFISYVTGE